MQNLAILCSEHNRNLCVDVSVAEAYYVSVLVINVFDKELIHMAIDL